MSSNSGKYSREKKLLVLEHYFRNGGDVFGNKQSTAKKFGVDSKAVNRFLQLDDLVKLAKRNVKLNQLRTKAKTFRDTRSGCESLIESLHIQLPDERSSDDSVLKQNSADNTTSVGCLLKAFELGTDKLRDILLNECDVVYECRVCRSLFRSLPNFLAHKQRYCRQRFVKTSLMGQVPGQSCVSENESSVIVLPTTSCCSSGTCLHATRSSPEDMVSNLPEVQTALLVEKRSQISAIHSIPQVVLEPIRTSKFAMYQTIGPDRYSTTALKDSHSSYSYVNTNISSRTSLMNSEASPKRAFLSPIRRIGSDSFGSGSMRTGIGGSGDGLWNSTHAKNSENSSINRVPSVDFNHISGNLLHNKCEQSASVSRNPTLGSAALSSRISLSHYYNRNQRLAYEPANEQIETTSSDNIINTDNLPVQKNDSVFRCFYCDKEFKSRSDKSQHTKSCHADEIVLFFCPLCKTELASQYVVQRHLQKVHKLKRVEIVRLRDKIKKLVKVSDASLEIIAEESCSDSSENQLKSIVNVPSGDACISHFNTEQSVHSPLLLGNSTITNQTKTFCHTSITQLKSDNSHNEGFCDAQMRDQNGSCTKSTTSPTDEGAVSLDETSLTKATVFVWKCRHCAATYHDLNIAKRHICELDVSESEGFPTDQSRALDHSSKLVRVCRVLKRAPNSRCPIRSILTMARASRIGLLSLDSCSGEILCSMCNASRADLRTMCTHLYLCHDQRAIEGRLNADFVDLTTSEPVRGLLSPPSSKSSLSDAWIPRYMLRFDGSLVSVVEEYVLSTFATNCDYKSPSPSPPSPSLYAIENEPEYQADHAEIKQIEQRFDNEKNSIRQNFNTESLDERDEIEYGSKLLVSCDLSNEALTNNAGATSDIKNWIIFDNEVVDLGRISQLTDAGLLQCLMCLAITQNRNDLETHICELHEYAEVKQYLSSNSQKSIVQKLAFDIVSEQFSSPDLHTVTDDTLTSLSREHFLRYRNCITEQNNTALCLLCSKIFQGNLTKARKHMMVDHTEMDVVQALRDRGSKLIPLVKQGILESNSSNCLSSVNISRLGLKPSTTKEPYSSLDVESFSNDLVMNNPNCADVGQSSLKSGMSNESLNYQTVDCCFEIEQSSNTRETNKTASYETSTNPKSFLNENMKTTSLKSKPANLIDKHRQNCLPTQNLELNSSWIDNPPSISSCETFGRISNDYSDNIQSPESLNDDRCDSPVQPSQQYLIETGVSACTVVDNKVSLDDFSITDTTMTPDSIHSTDVVDSEQVDLETSICSMSQTSLNDMHDSLRISSPSKLIEKPCYTRNSFTSVAEVTSYVSAISTNQGKYPFVKCTYASSRYRLEDCGTLSHAGQERQTEYSSPSPVSMGHISRMPVLHRIHDVPNTSLHSQTSIQPPSLQKHAPS